MPVELTYPHIVKNPGKPARLERHPRTRVAMIVVDYQGRGWSAEEIARQYAYLTLPTGVPTWGLYVCLSVQ